ncbi:MAG: Asp-tRNA(Asn)/Glu-tRNA(Gln) amidotransferase subunit GatC [Firmicutes bacterium]|jgi:aspartyl-tRNA(Asn)/glutamyl-tRNA(Gln) amidotransferase subunit C|nr:Asp-tRNA(Asn)/Glu-tRNA(Gln) amidotransferase subunit GatC [Bacillota bacterium]
MQVSPEELNNAALDARVELSATETKELLREVQSFFNLTKKLQEVDLEGIAATSYGHQEPNILRDDLIRSSLPLEESLANAPAVDESCFLVPRIIEE